MRTLTRKKKRKKKREEKKKKKKRERERERERDVSLMQSNQTREQTKYAFFERRILFTD
jgi:hypothetical protein